MNYFQLLVTFSAAIGGLLFGFEIGVVSQVLDMNSFGLQMHYRYQALNGTIYPCGQSANPTIYEKSQCFTPEEELTAKVTSFLLIGCIGGVLLVAFLADVIGRRWSIIMGSTFYTAGGFFQALAQTVPVFFVGRVVSGVGVGIMSMVVPMFIAETSPKEIRGRMTTSYQLMITFGIFLASSINTGIILSQGADNPTTWRICLAIQIIPGAILPVLMFFMPSSPSWLANVDRDDEALASIARLRGESIDSQVVQEEFDDIKTGIELDRSHGDASIMDLLKPGILNRVVIVAVLQMFQQFTGINAILYYQTSLFDKLGFGDSQKQYFTMAMNLINFFGTFPGMFLVERLGRKTLLIAGGIGMAISHGLICMFFIMSETNKPMAWGAVSFIATFFLCFASTWGPVVWVIQSEIFPLKVRSKGSAVGTISNWANNAIIAAVQPLMMKRIGAYTYLFFGACSVAMSLFTIIFVKETAGKTMEEIDEMFHFHESTAHNHEVEFEQKSDYPFNDAFDGKHISNVSGFSEYRE